MSKQQSNTEMIICKNCGTANQVPLAKRYFEGHKPPIPMYTDSTQRRGRQPAPPRCRVCKQILI